ncbi:PCRF domain-containing protein, partial [bacterium]|nr:PCRF domain-containing protein [bacterium]
MNCGGIFDFESKKSIITKLRKESTTADFWNNSDKASSILKNISIIKKELELWQDFERRRSDLEVLFEFAESDEASESDIVVELSEYETAIRDIELKLKLSGEMDMSNAILTIHPGAGGTESQDWADMLYRLYS